MPKIVIHNDNPKYRSLEEFLPEAVSDYLNLIGLNLGNLTSQSVTEITANMLADTAFRNFIGKVYGAGVLFGYFADRERSNE